MGRSSKAVHIFVAHLEFAKIAEMRCRETHVLAMAASGAIIIFIRM
jgi:hypothetical protein